MTAPAERSTLHQLLLDVRDGKLTAGRIGSTWSSYLQHADYSLPKAERSVLGRAMWSMGLIAVDTEVTNPGEYAPHQIVKSQPYLTEAGDARLARYEAGAR